MKVIEVKQDRREEFHSLHPSGLFTSQAWCDIYPDALIRFMIVDDQDKAIGGFVAYEGGKRGLKTLITPPFAPHCGLFALDQKNNPVKKNSFRKDIIDAIASFLKSSSYVYFKLDFSPDWVDMQPMLWQSIETNVRYTYRLDLKQTVEVITGNLDSSKRNKINKAEREGFSVTHEPDLEIAWKLISSNLKVNGIATHDQIMKGILAFTTRHQNCFFTFSEIAEKKLAVNISITDQEVCYNLLSAVDRTSAVTNAGTMSLYYSILHARDLGLRVFDFEGSGVPEIEEYFRSFGGSLVPYFSVCGGKKPWPWILKLTGKI